MIEHNATLFWALDEAHHVTVNGCEAKTSPRLYGSNIRTLVLADESVVEFEDQYIELDSEGYADAIDEQKCTPKLQFTRRVPLTPGQPDIANR